MISRALAAAAQRAGVEAVLARIAGPIGEAARAARGSRLERAEWSASARAPVPPGLRGVHPTWIEHALAELPARAREAVARGGGDPVDVWLARWACAGVIELAPVREVTAVRSIDDVLALDAAALAAWLAAIGMDQLGFVAAAAGTEAQRALVARFGEPLARALVRVGRPPRAGELGPLRAAVARCAGTSDPVAIGARALAPHALGHAQALALRLPRPVGVTVRAELLAHAHTEGPSWRALGA